MKALIVDDNSTNVLFVKRLVEKIDNCEALGFTDPLLVAAQLHQLDFDIALVDYVMPGLMDWVWCGPSVRTSGIGSCRSS